MAKSISSTTLNKISMFSYIHGKAVDMSRAYMFHLDNTPRYKDSTFDYRAYLTKSLSQDTTLDHSLFSLEFLYKNKIDSILNDAFKLNFLYDTNRSISGVYTDLEAVRNMNSIGIFDLSTCFYTTNYTKKLPFTSTFNSEKTKEYVFSDKFNNSKSLLDEVIDVKKLYSDMRSDEWRGVDFKNDDKVYGKLVFDVQNEDKSHILTFKNDSGFKSYYLDYNAYFDELSNYADYKSYYLDHYFHRSLNYKTDVRMKLITINNYDNVQFIAVRHGINEYKDECYALISTNLELPELYYSKDHINWTKFVDVDKNDKPLDKLIDVFNPETTEKLTDIWDYRKVTRKNISVLNMFKVSIEDNIVSIAQVIEKESDLLSANRLSDKTILMYSLDSKTWYPCNITEKMYDSSIFDYKYAKGLRLKFINYKFYIYNEFSIDSIKEDEIKDQVSVIVSENGIDWMTYFENKYIAYSVEGNDNNDIFILARENYYTEENCEFNNRDYLEDHKSTVKTYHTKCYVEYKSGTTGTENSVINKSISAEDYIVEKAFKLKDDLIIVYKPVSDDNKNVVHTIAKFDTENNVFKIMINSVSTFAVSKGKLFYTLLPNSNEIYSTIDINSEEKTIHTVSSDFSYGINNIEVLEKNDDTDFIIVNLINSDSNYNIWYAENTKEDGSLKFESFEDEDTYDFFIKKGYHIFAANTKSEDNLIYIIYTNYNEKTQKYELKFDGVCSADKDKNLGLIENINPNSMISHYSYALHADFTSVDDIELRAVSDNNFLIFNNAIKTLRVIPAISDIANCESYYIGSYKISDKLVGYGTDLIEKTAIYNNQLNNIFIADNKFFAIGKHVYYCDLDKHTIRDTGHTGKDYEIFNISKDAESIPQYGVFWNKHTKYCTSDVFVTFMGEDPEDFASLEEKRETDVPDAKTVDFLNKNNDYIYNYIKYNRYYQLSNVLLTRKETEKKIKEINNLTKFEDGVEYFEKDSDGNYIPINREVVTEPELVDESYEDTVNKVKTEINLSYDSEPDSSKLYYKLVEHKPGEIKEFDFTKEYYTKNGDEFELSDNATTPDENTTYYTFELFEDTTFDSSTQYYTFNSSTYIETVIKTKKVPKTYYIYENVEVTHYDLYVSKDHIHFYKIDDSISTDDIVTDKYGFFIIKDKTFFFSQKTNEIYRIFFNDESLTATLDPIMGYFNNGKMITKTDSEYKIYSIRINPLTEKASVVFTNGDKSSVILNISYEKSDYNAGECLFQQWFSIEDGWCPITLDEDNIIIVPQKWNEKVLSVYKLYGKSSVLTAKILYSDEVNKFLDNVTEKYLNYYQFNKLLDEEYNKIIDDFSNDFLNNFEDSFTFYQFVTKFGITSEKYEGSKVVKLYNHIIKMQEFIAFIVSSQEIIADSIKIYRELREGSKYEQYFKNINYIPHMYNILWSIVNSRLSKLDSIDANIPIYNYFSQKLITDNTGNKFYSVMPLGYKILDPIRESAINGATGDTNSNLDKVYSILTQNYDKTIIALKNYKPESDETIPSVSIRFNKKFIKYLYMATVTLQIFDVISSVSSINKKFDTINFDTIMKVLNIDYTKNYSDDEVYEDITTDLNEINNNLK